MAFANNLLNRYSGFFDARTGKGGFLHLTKFNNTFLGRIKSIITTGINVFTSQIFVAFLTDDYVTGNNFLATKNLNSKSLGD